MPKRVRKGLTGFLTVWDGSTLPGKGLKETERVCRSLKGSGDAERVRYGCEGSIMVKLHLQGSCIRPYSIVGL